MHNYAQWPLGYLLPQFPDLSRYKCKLLILKNNFRQFDVTFSNHESVFKASGCYPAYYGYVLWMMLELGLRINNPSYILKLAHTIVST